MKSEFMVDKNDIIANLDVILAFAEGLNDEIKQIDLEAEISTISDLKQKIQNNELLPYEDKVLDYFNPLIEKIITWNPVIKEQLKTFWKLQREIIHQLFLKNDTEQYYPIKELNERLKESNKIYSKTVKRFKENKSDIVYFYALLYSHVTRHEVIEEEIKTHLTENIQRAGLEKKFNLNDMFYVNKKVPRWNKETTDVKAVRDALSHLKYEIIRLDGDWKLHFCNNDYGYNFNEEIARDDFTKFVYDLEILYKSMFVLSIILSTISMLGKYTSSVCEDNK